MQCKLAAKFASPGLEELEVLDAGELDAAVVPQGVRVAAAVVHELPHLRGTTPLCARAPDSLLVVKVDLCSAASAPQGAKPRC